MCIHASELPLKNVMQIEKKLVGLTSNQVLWHIEDRSLMPPWGDQISDSITDLSNYFVTSSGEDFLDVFQNALDKAQQLQVPLCIQAL